MGNINNHITITISKTSTGVTRLGFGTLMFLSGEAAFPERVRSYSGDAAVAVDFPNARSAVRRASAIHFGQSTSPKTFKVGRRANKSTQIIQLTVAAVRNNYTYGVWVAGTAFDRVLVTFTSSGSATDANVAAGLVSALNAVVSKTYTATGAASPISCTATTAGDVFWIEPVSVDDLTVNQTHVDPGVTADLTAIALADSDFYMVYSPTPASAETLAIATWTEANKRTFMCDVNESSTVTTTIGAGGDIAKALNTATRSRTYCFWTHRLDHMIGVGLAGRCLPLTPGSETWADKSIAGGEATVWLTDTHRGNITARKANGYEIVAGIGVTFNGTTSSGDYYDTIRLLDAFADDAQKSIFTAKVNSNKIGFDDPGILKIVNEFRGALNRMVSAGGFIAESIKITYPQASEIPPADRASRTLNGIRGEAQLTSAVQNVNLSINVIA